MRATDFLSGVLIVFLLYAGWTVYQLKYGPLGG